MKSNKNPFNESFFKKMNDFFDSEKITYCMVSNTYAIRTGYISKRHSIFLNKIVPKDYSWICFLHIGMIEIYKKSPIQ